MLKEYFSRKSVIFLLVCLTAFLGYLRFVQYRQKASIDSERASLESQISSVERKNQEMEASIKYLSSLSSKEKVAREQLNLKKQGEKVYSFTQIDGRGGVSAKYAADDKSSNPAKWWRYFTE